jgi:hypothetical protein
MCWESRKQTSMSNIKKAAIFLILGDGLKPTSPQNCAKQENERAIVCKLVEAQ